MPEDFEIFKGKTFSSLTKDIYNNAAHKRAQIDLLIGDLRKMIKSLGDITIIGPMIKDYIDSGIKNDDQLIKLSAIHQRLISAEQKVASMGDAYGLSDDEKDQLLASVKSDILDVNQVDIEIANHQDELDKKLDALELEVDVPLDGEVDQEE